MKAVFLLIVLHVIVTSSFPYSHLANIRNRRIPNPRQIYKNQRMLLRGSRKVGIRTPDDSSRSGNRFRPRDASNQSPEEHDDNDQSSPYRAHRPIPQFGRNAEPSYRQRETQLSRDESPNVPLANNGQPLTRESEQPEEPQTKANKGNAPDANLSLTNREEEQSEIGDNGNAPSNTHQHNPDHSRNEPAQLENSYQPIYGRNSPLSQQPGDQQPSFRRNGPLRHSPSDQLPTYLGNGQLFQPSDDQQRPFHGHGSFPLPQQPLNKPPTYLGNGRLLPPANNLQQPHFGNGRMLPPFHDQPLNHLGNNQALPRQEEQQPSYLPNGGQMPLINDQHQPFYDHRSQSHQQPAFHANPPHRPSTNDQGSFSNNGPLLPSHHEQPSLPYHNNGGPLLQPREGNLQPYLNNGEQPATYPGNEQLPKAPAHEPQEPLSYQQSKRNFDTETGLHPEEPANDATDRQQENGNTEIAVDGDCSKIDCPELVSCVNSTKVGCCDVCVKHGCQCEGYQKYDCISNGFEGGLVPEGESYTVDTGSTICSCPRGGGTILCSYQDQFSHSDSFQPQPNAFSPVENNPLPAQDAAIVPKVLCIKPPPSCIESHTRPNGCEECDRIGCVDHEGGKHAVGSSYPQSKCTICYCPPEGGELFCVRETNCNVDPSQTSLALEATQRVMRDPLSVETKREYQPIGYDTRYLQPDWNNFGSERQDEKSPGGGESDSNDVVVPPVVSPVINQPSNPLPRGLPSQHPSGNFYQDAGNGNEYYQQGYNPRQFNPYYRENEFPAAAETGQDSKPANQESEETGDNSSDEILTTKDDSPHDSDEQNVRKPNPTNFAPNMQQQNYPVYPGNNQGYYGPYQADPYGYHGYNQQQPLPGQDARPVAHLPSQHDETDQSEVGKNTKTGNDQSSEDTDSENGNNGLPQFPQQNNENFPLNQPGFYGNQPYGMNPYGFQNYNQQPYLGYGNQPIVPLSNPEDGSKPATNSQENSESEKESNSEVEQTEDRNTDRQNFPPNHNGNFPNYPNNQPIFPNNQLYGVNSYGIPDYSQQPVSGQLNRAGIPLAIPQDAGQLQSSAGDVTNSESSQENGESTKGNDDGPHVTQHLRSHLPFYVGNQQGNFGAMPYGPQDGQEQAGSETQEPSNDQNDHDDDSADNQQQGEEDTEHNADVEPNLTLNSQGQSIFPLANQNILNGNNQPLGQEKEGSLPVSQNTLNQPINNNNPNNPPIIAPHLRGNVPVYPGNQPNLYGNLNYVGYGPANPSPNVLLPQHSYQPYNGLPSHIPNHGNPNVPINNPNTMNGLRQIYPDQFTQQGNQDSIYPYQPFNPGYNGYFSPLPNEGRLLSQAERLNFNRNKENGTSLERIPGVEPTRITLQATTTALIKQTMNELNHFAVSNNQSASFENVLSACCYEGKQWAISHDTCYGIEVTVNTYSQICAVAQEKCCRKAKQQEHCTAGVTTARSMSACTVPTTLHNQCDRDGFKTCCDCCALGLKAYSLSLNCDMEILGEPCNAAYSECCRKGRLASTSMQGTPLFPSSAPSQTVTSRQESEAPSIPRCATNSNCPQLCVDNEAGIECACLEGYRLEDDGRSCTDINECVLGTHDCVEGQFCLNLMGSFNCQRSISCGTGYELTDKNTCNDIDECALNLHNCDAMLDCVNIRGSFRCIPKMCDDGYLTDARGGCIDIDECRGGDFSCPLRAHCENTVGSYSCRCPDGLAFDRDGHLCEDINECESGSANCADGSTCLNTDGSYTCLTPPTLKCTAGYEANQAETACVDVDECARGTHTCSAGSTCINDEGSFRCEDPIQCNPGTRPSANQRRCIDVNECEESNVPLCGSGGTCLNIPGSYRCECNRGFRKENLPDGREICEDIDECDLPSGQSCTYRCENNPGSYACICPSGYTESRFDRSCEDVDECLTKRDNCSASETCFNIRGGFRCVELDCPDHYAKLLNRRCVRKSCRKVEDRRSCSKLPKQITYHNITVRNNAPGNKALFRMSLAKGYSTDRYYFLLTKGNEGKPFKVAKRRLRKRQTGIVYTTRPLHGPRDYVLDLTLKLYRKRRWATFISRLYIYVSEYDF